MPAPEEATATTAAPERVAWMTEEELRAAFAAADWFARSATPELVAPYKGMHVAILGERIIDADRDFKELARRLDTGEYAGEKQMVFRYIRTDEEATRSRY